MKKRIWGIVLIMGIILALGASAFGAGVTKKPVFTTKSLADGTAGSTYSAAVEVTVDSSDAAWTIELVSPTIAELAKYNLVVNNGTTAFTDAAQTATLTKGTLKGTLTVATLTANDGKIIRASKSGIKIKFKATNESNTVEKEYTLKIKGVEPSITSPTAEDLGATFMPSTGTAPMNKGVGVVGRALPTTNAITIQAGKGTLPITMTDRKSTRLNSSHAR